MSSIGSRKNPAFVRVQTPERAQQVIDLCKAHDIHCIAGVEPDKLEDISDIERAMQARRPAQPLAPDDSKSNWKTDVKHLVRVATSGTWRQSGLLSDGKEPVDLIYVDHRTDPNQQKASRRARRPKLRPPWI